MAENKAESKVGKMRIVDFRSDTVTSPTPKMREAMYHAEVGDDVYEEDPTVKRLERIAAAKTGFEAGLFVTSGTMGNLLAVMTHTQKGDEVLLEAESHIYYYEVGSMAALAGVMPRLIPGQRGILKPELLKKNYRSANIHYPRPTLLCLENTHNRGGGSVMRPEEMAAVVAAARELGLKVHLDGARIFNAAVACKCDVSELTRGADSVQICLSKGLAAPLGSVLLGSAEYIARARKFRKMIGGGLRQVGIVAAAGIVALEEMVDRLADDHRLAARLANGLSATGYLQAVPEEVETNIVVAYLNTDIMGADTFVRRLSEAGIKLNIYDSNRLRFVTHKDISENDLDYALQVMIKLRERI